MKRNFRYLDDLIHSGAERIVLTSDIVLDEGEEEEYGEGIRLDVDGLIINACGHSIDARSKAGIFYCTGEVTITDAVLKNASGAIYNSRGILNISKSEFIDNGANLVGGAIYNYWGEVNIDGSIFRGNASGCHGGAIFNVDGEINISNSEFSHNSAKNDGGAVFSGVAKLNVDDCTFSENSAGGSGGAIYANIGEVNIRNSRLFGNVSEGIFGGGAIHKNRGFLNIADSELSGNSAKGDGGAVFNIDAEGSIIKSQFLQNASKGQGSAICDWGELVITDCRFCPNDGDALYSADNYVG